MSLNLATVFLFGFILLYIVIIEIFTVLFRITGMSEERAKLQVISMLTNSGFTTSESEIIVSSRKRRSLARATMLFGYTFTVAIVSTLVNLVLAASRTEAYEMYTSVIAFIAFVSILLILKKIPFIKDKFDSLMRKIGKRIMFSKRSNPLLMLDKYGSNALCEITLTDIPKSLIGKSIIDAKIRSTHGITVIALIKDGVTNANLDGSEFIEHYDKILVFGALKHIKELFEKEPSF